MRGRTPASTSTPSRSRSRTRVPSSECEMRLRSSCEDWSLAPRSLNIRLAHPSETSCRRLSRPALYAARPNWKAEEPSMSVRSRSKNAAGDPSAAIDLDDHGVALAATGADRGPPEPAAAAPKLEQERAEDAGAGGADRVAERDRAAVDVDLVLVEAEHPHRVERHRRERLIDLPQIDVVDLEAGLLERLLGGVRRGPGQIREVVGNLRMSDDRGQNSLAVGLGPIVARDDQRAGAIVDARRVPGRVGPVLHEDRRKLGERLESGIAPGRLVDLDDRVALLALDRHRDDLLGEAALVGRLDRELVRAERPAVEVDAAQLELGRDLARLLRHVLAAERIGEPVVDHRVKRLPVAHAEAEPRLLEQVRRLRHRLHPARDPDVEVPDADGVVEQAGRANSGRADLVDRLRGDLLGDPALDLRLARGNLALAGLEHLAEHDVLDLIGRDVGTLERRLDRGSAELGRIDAGQAAAEFADRRPGGREDHGLGHVVSLS